MLELYDGNDSRKEMLISCLPPARRKKKKKNKEREKKGLKFIDDIIANRFTNNRWSTQLYKGRLPFTLLTGTRLNLYVQTVKRLLLRSGLFRTPLLSIKKDKNVTIKELHKNLLWFPEALIEKYKSGACEGLINIVVSYVSKEEQ